MHPHLWVIYKEIQSVKIRTNAEPLNKKKKMVQYVRQDFCEVITVKLVEVEKLRCTVVDCLKYYQTQGWQPDTRVWPGTAILCARRKQRKERGSETWS